MGASLTGEDDFDDMAGLDAFLHGDDPIVETADGAPKASVNENDYERDEREAIQGTAAAVGQARPNDAPKAEKLLMDEIKPNAQSAKTNAPKAERREQSVDVAEIDYDPSRRPEPRIIYRQGAEHDLAEKAKSFLNREKTWYARGPEIVTIIRSGENGCFVSIAAVPYARFFTRFCGLARWGIEKYNASTKQYEFIDRRAPDPVARSVFAAMQWPTLRYLRLVVDTPIIRPDGTIFQTPDDYDPVTGFYYAPTIDFPLIPIDATHDDAVAAMRRLRDIFRDFKYTKAGMDAVVISGIMSLVGRSAIEGPVPGHLYNAHQKGTGKTLQMDVTSQIAFGHEPELFQLGMPREDDSHQTDRDEEQEKRLYAAAREGARALFIDNARNGGSFGGPVIDRYTIATIAKGRTLGKSELVSCPWLAIFFVSGNNVYIMGDSQRRFLESMLSPICAKPELRDQSAFTHDLVGGFALNHRGEIIADILTILVAHARARRPRGKRADISNFESWQRVIADAMVWAGGPDPSQFFVSRSDSNDPVDVAKIHVMRYLYNKGACAGGSIPDGLTCKEIVDELFTTEWVNKKSNPDTILDPCRDALVEVATAKGKRCPDPTSLGRAFRSWKGSLLEGADIWGKDDARAHDAYCIDVGKETRSNTQRGRVATRAERDEAQNASPA